MNSVEPWVKAGADLPKAVLNLAKPDSRKQKRKIQKSKIEREELQTKLPKRDLKATETVSQVVRSGLLGRGRPLGHMARSFRPTKIELS